MPKKYTVNDGHTLLMPDGSVAGAGDVVVLDADSAERHSARVTLVVKASAPAPAKSESEAETETETEPKSKGKK